MKDLWERIKHWRITQPEDGFLLNLFELIFWAIVCGIVLGLLSVFA